jgi:hypothetical protein
MSRPLQISRADAKRLGITVARRARVVTEVVGVGARHAYACVPYTAEAWSKNKAWRHRKDGRVYLSTPAREARETLTALLRQPAWPQRKTWLVVDVYLGDHRSDPINTVDGLADSVKIAIGVDDRFFAIKHLDWFIDPENPRIEVQVYQDAS